MVVVHPNRNNANTAMSNNSHNNNTVTTSATLNSNTNQSPNDASNGGKENHHCPPPPPPRRTREEEGSSSSYTQPQQSSQQQSQQQSSSSSSSSTNIQQQQQQEKQKQQIHHHETVLRQFEATRRSKCKAKLDSTRLYWKAHVHLLKQGYKEVSQVYRLVVGLAHAQTALANDVVASTTNRVSGSKRRNGSSRSSSSSSCSVSSTTGNNNNNNNIRTNALTELCGSLTESTQYMHQLWRKQADDWHHHTLGPRLLELVTAAKETWDECTVRGTSLLDAMQVSETNVTEAWGTYWFVMLCYLFVRGEKAKVVTEKAAFQVEAFSFCLAVGRVGS